MRPIRLSTMTALAFTAGLLSHAGATLVPAQKGIPCLAMWDTFTAEALPPSGGNKPWQLDCGDGDPDCDADGQPDGQCTISLSACTLQTSEAGCVVEPLSRLKISKQARKRFTGLGDPSLTETSCGAPGVAVLKLHGKKQRLRGKKQKPSKPVVVAMNFKAATGKGHNKLRVRCVKATTGCPDRESSGLPKQATFTVPKTGSDLDTGFSGASHNFPVVHAAQLRYCLSNCDGTTDPVCDMSGDTGPDSLNGPTFGASLPLLSASVPVCVVNRFASEQGTDTPKPITGTFNLSTGEGESLVELASEVYLRLGLSDEVCPRCIVPGGVPPGQDPIGLSGRCSQTASNANAPCRVNGTGFVSAGSTDALKNYLLSTDCRPQGELAGTLAIRLPLTTGSTSSPAQSNYCPGQTQNSNCNGPCNAQCLPGGPACVRTNAQGECIDDKGGISQLCCASNRNLPCFPTGNNPPEAIVRQGSPVVPGDPAGGVFAANFCIPFAGGVVSSVAGLPGPGALLLPAVVEIADTP